MIIKESYRYMMDGLEEGDGMRTIKAFATRSAVNPQTGKTEYFRDNWRKPV